jgi:hypothetical protein
MEKKSFRHRKPQAPSYPRLRDVDRGTLTSWGLATLGGLLLGGAACTPAHADPEPRPMPGVPPVERVEKAPEGKSAAAPDAGATETVVVTMGKPVAPRFEERKGKTSKSNKGGAKKGDKGADEKADKKLDDSKPKPGQKDHAGTAGQASAGNAVAAPPKDDTPRMMGKMRMPRVEDEPAKEKKDPPKK